MAGVAAMKTSEPSLSEQILQYESTGECTAAFISVTLNSGQQIRVVFYKTWRT